MPQPGPTGPGPRWPSDDGLRPSGSRISLGHGDGTVVVKVSSPVNGPAGLFGHWATIRVEAEAVAAQEPNQ